MASLYEPWRLWEPGGRRSLPHRAVVSRTGPPRSGDTTRPGSGGASYDVPVRIHLDTDLGGDPDDACALAMLLGWPGVEIAGITTTIDPGGSRAARVCYCLRLAGRDDIPVVAGAGVSMTTGRVAEPYAGEPYWPSTIAPRPSPPGAALDLLHDNIEEGATVVAIGPYTNLALLEEARPGSLSGASVVVMGGWIQPPATGLPGWGPERDWNVQWDTQAAARVANAATNLTLVTLPVTLKSHLRAADLPRLRKSGQLGALLARQSEAHANDSTKATLPASNTALPSDFLNFHYDPVTCAVALGWPGAAIDEMPLASTLDGQVFRWYQDPNGKPVRVVVDLDGQTFTETWLAAVEAAQRT